MATKDSPQTTRNDELSALIFDAINASPTEEEIEAACKPPYPTPSCYIPFETVAREALKSRLEQGVPDPMCTMRLLEYAERFSDVASRVFVSDRMFGVSDMICLLLAGGLIPVATVQKAIGMITARLTPQFLNRAIVYRHLADGDVEAAKAACDEPVMEEKSWTCWRAVGEHYAECADPKSFLSLWPKYQAGQKRDWMDNMRRSLIASVSKTHGWQKAVLLTQNKKIGLKGHEHGMLYVALTPIAETGDTATLRNLFATEECLSALSEIARIQLLLNAMSAATPHPPQTDPPELDDVLARIIAIDPTVSKQQSRRRDWLLLGCWPLIGEEATLKRVRAAIRAPIYKREINALRKTAIGKRVRDI